MSAVAMGSSAPIPSSPTTSNRNVEVTEPRIFNRAEIRKKQNRDSARRSREKRKSHLRGVAESVEIQSRRVRELDARVAQLEALVQRAVRPRNTRGGGGTSKKPPQAPRRAVNNPAAVAAAAAAAATAVAVTNHPVSSLEIQRSCAAPTTSTAATRPQASVMTTALSRSAAPPIVSPASPAIPLPPHPSFQSSLALPAAALLEISATPSSFADIAVPTAPIAPTNLHAAPQPAQSQQLPVSAAANPTTTAAATTTGLYDIPLPAPAAQYSQGQAPPPSALTFAIDPWTIGNDAIDPLSASAPMPTTTASMLPPSAHTTQHTAPSPSAYHNYGL